MDAVAWLEERGALRMADGSALGWANDPERAEALYDIDREVVAAIYAPSRVLQHLGSVTELLDKAVGARRAGPGPGGAAAGRRAAGPPARPGAAGRLLRGRRRVRCAASCGPRRWRRTWSGSPGSALERRAEGVALVDIGRRLSDTAFPAGGTVAQAALLLCARIAGYLRHTDAGRFERLPAATAARAAGRGGAAAGRGAAGPRRADCSPELLGAGHRCRSAAGRAGRREPTDPPETAYPFLSDAWLRTALRKLVADFGAGMAEKQAADPDRLLADALRPAGRDGPGRGWTAACWSCRCWPATAR